MYLYYPPAKHSGQGKIKPRIMFYPFIISNIKLVADKITIRINNIVLCFSLIFFTLDNITKKG